MLIKKLFNVGFEEIDIMERRPFGLADCSRYPLFAPDFIEFLRKTLPADRHGEVVHSIVVTARRPLREASGPS